MARANSSLERGGGRCLYELHLQAEHPLGCVDKGGEDTGGDADPLSATSYKGLKTRDIKHKKTQTTHSKD